MKFLAGLLAIAFFACMCVAADAPPDPWDAESVKQLKADVVQMKADLAAIKAAVLKPAAKACPCDKGDCTDAKGCKCDGKDCTCNKGEKKGWHWPWDKEKSPECQFNEALEHCTKERKSLVTWIGGASCPVCEASTKEYVVHLHVPKLDGDASPRAHVSYYAAGRLWKGCDLTAPFDCEKLKDCLTGSCCTKAAGGGAVSAPVFQYAPYSGGCSSGSCGSASYGGFGGCESGACGSSGGSCSSGACGSGGGRGFGLFRRGGGGCSSCGH